MNCKIIFNLIAITVLAVTAKPKSDRIAFNIDFQTNLPLKIASSSPHNTMCDVNESPVATLDGIEIVNTTLITCYGETSTPFGPKISFNVIELNSIDFSMVAYADIDMEYINPSHIILTFMSKKTICSVKLFEDDLITKSINVICV